jgi:outer membrane lipoprotein-sorting protein
MTAPNKETPRHGEDRQSDLAGYKLPIARFLGFISLALLLIWVPDAAAQAGDLEKVLSSMDKGAANFRSAEVDFTADQYEAVVKEHTIQQGVMYIRKVGSDIQMAADFNQPADQRKYVLYTGTEGKVELYQPKINQITVYRAGKNKEAFQSFLVLGFGSPGHDLGKQFEAKYAGAEDVSGIKTDKLELTPKSERVRNMFNRIVLWIDAQGLSVQQEFFDPDGNYRLVKYSNFRINGKLPHDAFKLKTTGKPTIVNGP